MSILNLDNIVYEVAKVIIDGIEYIINPVTSQTLCDARPFEDKANAGDVEAKVNQLHTITDIPVDVLKKLEFAKLVDLTTFVINNSVLGKKKDLKK
jgi:hypothetical protein